MGLAACLVATTLASAGFDPQPLEVVHTFGYSQGHPVGRLVLAPNGSVYGATEQGGTLTKGSIFRLTPAGPGTWDLTEVHSFIGTDGETPGGGLLLASDGQLYGTTANGGKFGGGTLYRVDLEGRYTRLYSFPYLSNPRGELVEAPDGSLWGTTFGGGADAVGTIFRSDRSGNLTTLHSFDILVDGAWPMGLVVGPEGTLYGITTLGGPTAQGTFFRVETDGTTTVLHSFAFDTDGGAPNAPPIVGSDGHFYGTCMHGGANAAGTIYRVDTQGNFANLHDMNVNADGSVPAGPLLEASSGVFLGTASSGGDHGAGTAFRFEPPATLARLHDFTGDDGYSPRAGFVSVGNGHFLSTTFTQGAHEIGNVFGIDALGTFAVVASLKNLDGGYPSAPLIEASDGNLYGTTTAGGANGWGTLFRVGASDSYEVLHAFTFEEGTDLRGPLAEDADGALYGTAADGGPSVRGSLFRFDPTTRDFAVLHDFGVQDGYSPRGGLVRGSDDLFYGSGYYGGTNAEGTLFRVDSDGNFEKLWDFTGAEGAKPAAPLVEASDGLFYGTAPFGGTGDGTVYALDPEAGATLVHALAGDEGSAPQSALVEVSDGTFYGTAYSGGPPGSDFGTVFQVTTAGAFQSVHAFAGSIFDGAYPMAGLTLASDGNLYGTTGSGGLANRGTVFKLDDLGEVTSLVDFGAYLGYFPSAGLIQAADGGLYGTTQSGGLADNGVVFRILPGDGIPTSILSEIAPTSGPAAGGRFVRLRGQHFYPLVNYRFGAYTFSGQSFDSRTAFAVSPELEPGTLNDVEISNNGQSSGGTIVDAFFADFLDVDLVNPFHDYVESIVRAGVTAGCGSGNYCPSQAVTRGQMAVLLLKAKLGPDHVPPSCTGMVFQDVPCTGAAFDPWIEELFSMGITGGCQTSPPLYCPGDAVNRQQMAVFLLKTEHDASFDPPDCVGLFEDVPCTPGTGFSDWIETLYDEGVTGGCQIAPLRYCPTSPNTRAQMAVFLVKTFSLE